ncbi:PIN domain-containing protein [Polaribacter sp. M15]|tara:strand:+ start:337 stop:789 length:453 start_codon:yes stop_codon:yes gene_type:complete
MKLIDTNALIVLIIGLIDPRLINKHKRTSIYEEKDFEDLISFVGDFNELVVLPNVWTEVDNLLNNFKGNRKTEYIEKITSTIKLTTEKILETKIATESETFYDLGITDSLLFEYSKKCELLITSDSSLSDYAIANGVKVFDLVKNRNERI